MKTRVLFLVTLLCAVAASLQSIHASTITVMNTNDSGPGSLRDALAASKDGDMIDATAVSGTILLSTGELQITHNVTINGPGIGRRVRSLTIDGNSSFRVFENFASNVTISGFAITEGFVDDVNGGGGILNRGGLTLDEAMISNCGAPTGIHRGVGGGINNIPGATLTVIGSIFKSNYAGSGGGIFGDNGAIVMLIDSTVSGNSGGGAGGAGGGIYILNAQLAVINSTISGNSSTVFGGGGGGGINNDGGTATVTNSTISGNSAGLGGAIYNNGTTTIGDTILNSGDFGGTIFISGGTITSLGFNLASDNGGGFLTGPGDQINSDPLLGPLQDNGGPTLTHALLPGSPAIDAGDPSFTPPPFYDQRGPGFARVINARIDIGSFEVQQSTPTPVPTATATATPAATVTPTSTPRRSPTPRPTVTPRPRP